MTINKLEFIGIALSIMAMAGALWFLRLDSAPGPETAVGDRDTSPVAVADGDNQRAAIADALLDASDGVNSMERLVIDDITIGNGEEVGEGDTVTVHYIGRLQNGQEFDNSYKRGAPFTFTIGDGRVIEGWEQGVAGMKVGGERILVVPPELAYGESGFGPIPGNATLVFAVELLSVE